jgi:hypothetical protein
MDVRKVMNTTGRTICSRTHITIQQACLHPQCRLTYSIHESALGAPAYSSNTTLHFGSASHLGAIGIPPVGVHFGDICLRRLLHSLLHPYHTTRTSVPSFRPHLLQLPSQVMTSIVNLLNCRRLSPHSRRRCSWIQIMKSKVLLIHWINSEC